MRSVAPERRAAAPDQQQNNDVKRALYKIKPQINIVLRIFEMRFLRFIPDAPRPLPTLPRHAARRRNCERISTAHIFVLYKPHI